MNLSSFNMDSNTMQMLNIMSNPSMIGDFLKTSKPQIVEKILTHLKEEAAKMNLKEGEEASYALFEANDNVVITLAPAQILEVNGSKYWALALDRKQYFEIDYIIGNITKIVLGGK